MISWRSARTALVAGLLASVPLVGPLRAAHVPQAAGASASSASPAHFYLKDGDRVCFYGDSITEQRFYPAEVQTYALTRFPHLHVRYIDAAVGGDRVTGGWAGPIDLRLKRDVFPFHPNIVTIMLGMNDAGYQPFNEKLFTTYKTGYEHIITSMQQHLPGVRIVLLLTSPYDEQGFDGGYNAVLDRYDAFVRELGARYHLPVVDFNGPMNRVLNQAYKSDGRLAHKFFPGYIHPSAAAEMMMAQQLLKAWGAPATVTNVALNVNGGSASVSSAVNSSVSGVNVEDGTVKWSQLDGSLPLPVLGLHAKWPQFPAWNIALPPQASADYTDPVAALIDKMSGFTHDLDQERLQVAGLTAPSYTLSIDGDKVGTFTSAELASGVNLARYFTPMLRQAYDVQNLVWEEIQVHFEAWHGVQTTLGNFGWKSPNLPVSTENNPATAQAVLDVVRDMGRIQSAIAQQELVANLPHAHQYVLTPVQ